VGDLQANCCADNAQREPQLRAGHRQDTERPSHEDEDESCCILLCRCAAFHMPWLIEGAPVSSQSSNIPYEPHHWCCCCFAPGLVTRPLPCCSFFEATSPRAQGRITTVKLTNMGAGTSPKKSRAATSTAKVDSTAVGKQVSAWLGSKSQQVQRTSTHIKSF
jgi:hypothetical protein